MPKVNKRWCDAGTTHVFLQQDNTITPCCALKMSDTYPFYRHQLPESTNLLKAMKSFEWRDKLIPLINGPLPDGQCEQCITQEAETGDSIRKNIARAGVTHPSGFFLHVDFSNKCNLKCVMCSSYRSTGWIKDEIALGEYAEWNKRSEYKKLNDNWWADTPIDWWRNIGRIEVSGGEPFYEPQFFEFLDFLLSIGKSDVWLNIITNVTLYTDEIGKKLSKFKSVKLLCSVDGWTDNIYTYARGGRNHSLSDVKDNIKKMSRNFNDIMIVDTLHCITYDQPKIAKKWIADNNLEIKHTTNYVFTPDYLNARTVLPIEFMPNYQKDPVAQDRFIRWINKLDKIRGTNILDVRPEFTEWFDSHNH